VVGGGVDDARAESGGLAPGATVRQTLTKAGTWANHRANYPNMKATIVAT
jgi:hypothetical protein